METFFYNLCSAIVGLPCITLCLSIQISRFFYYSVISACMFIIKTIFELCVNDMEFIMLVTFGNTCTPSVPNYNVSAF